MANFDSGVARYIRAQCTVVVNFPVDMKGRESIACRYCPYLSSNERMCQLNKMPVAFPNNYVGEDCPLTLIEEDKEDV